ncbi:MAG: KH domain-containing protein [Bacilli bacterium]|nr:KH domain-containing protein [Bacilli bacterium]
MDYEKIVRTLIEPIVEEPDSVLIRINEGTTPKDVLILIAAEKNDTARLIGRRGIIANALREMVSVAGKSENKRIHLRFESFDEEKVED